MLFNPIKSDFHVVDFHHSKSLYGIQWIQFTLNNDEFGWNTDNVLELHDNIIDDDCERFGLMIFRNGFLSKVFSPRYYCQSILMLVLINLSKISSGRINLDGCNIK